MVLKRLNVTSENLPQIVSLLVNEVTNLKELFNNQPTKESRIPIGIDEACCVLGKAKPTVYTMVRKRLIPCYKNGKKLYFYEDELIECINSGRLMN